MAISQNFPDVRPSLNLNFARSKTLDPRITFERASIGTYVDENGLIKTAAADEARFDHDPVTGESLGLLIEESRTNLVSTNIDSWNDGYGSSFKINQAAIAPDGTLTAVKIGRGTAANYQIIYASFANIPTNTPLIFSFYLKAAEYDSVLFQTNDGNWINQFFDISSGITSLGSSIDDAGMYSVGNGWHRCWVKFDSASNTLQLTIHPTTSSPVAGDGTSGEFIWGVQLEAGAFPTSYIPTSGSTITRQPDNAQITGTNFTDFYNATEGSLYTRFIINGIDPGYNNTSVMIHDNTENNYIAIFGYSPAYAWVQSSGSTSAGLALGSPTSTGIDYKVSMGYKLNDFAGSISGLIYTDNSGSIPEVNTMYIGRRYTLNKSLNGHIKQLRYYPERLTNTQLQNLTK